MDAYTLPPLRYDYNALEPAYDARSLELHHAKHHVAYVAGLNRSVEKLATQTENLADAQRDFAFHFGGHVLHSVFWEVLSPPELASPLGGPLEQLMVDTYGGVDGLLARLKATAAGVQGAGWAALIYEPIGSRLVVKEIHDHQTGLLPSISVLAVVDVWEHAYYLSHQNRRADWIDAVVGLLDWGRISSRLTSAIAAAAAGSL